MKNAVTNKIRLLKDVQPNPDWLKSQRSNLLLEISKSDKQGGLPGFLVGIVLFCLIFGGSFLAVLAAKNSLPGDLLYPVKIITEDARVKVYSQETKPKLQAEFVGNRVEELSQIIEEIKDPIEKKERVVRAVDKLQAQVVNTKFHVVEAAEAVSEKTAQVEEILMEAKEKVASEEVTKVIDEALAAILDANKKREIWIQMEVIEMKKGEVPVDEIPSE